MVCYCMHRPIEHHNPSTDGGALVVPHHFEALAPFIREVVGAIGVFEPLERRVEVAQAAQQALLPEG